MEDIKQRKQDHIKIVMSGAAQHGLPTGFDRVAFVHNAMPEIDFDEIDLSIDFLGRHLNVPFLASSMTGGPAASGKINYAIAEAAQELGFAMAVGSQRIALTTEHDHGLNLELRKLAPDIPIYSNLGAVQLVHSLGVDDAKRAVEAIGANALILHLNPLQEVLQDGGDRKWFGVERAIAALVRGVQFPVIVKEVGAGISVDVARRLVQCGIDSIDVAGAGGTSWAAVEGQRAGETGDQALGEIFRNWGLPTPLCIEDIHLAFPNLPLIASGGIRNGLDGAKAIRLGASLVGQAGSLLPVAIKGTDAVIDHVRLWAKALQIACFATGSRSLADLRAAKLQPV